jgi:sec-independent protein translocase protein TatC
MGKAGLVSAEGLGAVRKYAMVGILLLAALVTPPDVVTQLILFTVVYGLYEISILLVGRVEKKRDDKLREEGYFDDEEEFDDPLMREFDEDLAAEEEADDKADKS